MQGTATSAQFSPLPSRGHPLRLRSTMWLRPSWLCRCKRRPIGCHGCRCSARSTRLLHPSGCLAKNWEREPLLWPRGLTKMLPVRMVELVPPKCHWHCLVLRWESYRGKPDSAEALPIFSDLLWLTKATPLPLSLQVRLTGLSHWGMEQEEPLHTAVSAPLLISFFVRK